MITLSYKGMTPGRDPPIGTLGVERLTVSISAQLLALTTEDDLETAIPNLLQEVAESVGADGISLLRFSTDKKRMSSSHMWNNNRINVSMNSAVDLKCTAGSIERFSRGENISLMDTSDALQPERGFLETFGMRTVHEVPLFYGGDLVGFFAWTSARPNVSCSSDELAFFRVIGELVFSSVERLKTMRALEESEARYRSVVEDQVELVMRFHPNGAIDFVNRSMCHFLGRAAKEIIGHLLVEFINENDVAAYRHFMMSVGPGNTVAKADLPLSSAGENRTLSWTLCAIISGGGVLEYQASARDVTEERVRQMQLIQADKMVTLGTLVSGVAHEINNPNHFISSNIGPLRDAWQDALRILDLYYEERGDFAFGRVPYSERRNQVPKMLQSIQGGSTRIKTIVEELREYAQRRPTQMEGSVDLNQEVRAATNLVSSQIKKATRHFTLETEKLPRIRANSQRLQQVVINLVLNACQAVRNDDTPIRVSTRFDSVREVILLKVADEGIGIQVEHLEQVTDPFYTTKRASGGTGLGLSISLRIVEEHGGTIRFESSPDQGTVVSVALPTARESGGES